jgi:hypothetical protein
MKMFEMLGLNLKTIYESFTTSNSRGRRLSICATLGENLNGQDQDTLIERNLEA